MAEGARSSILLPLYIYPNPGAWDPLYDAIATHQNLNFVIIVNPDSGPGSRPWWPNADYVREIPRLSAQTNVRIVGYVRTAYCCRPIEEVCRDIDMYAGWNEDDKIPGVAVEGIFFDETPNLYSSAVRDYLDATTKKVKNTNGILGDRLVIQNPGTAVDARLASPGPDLTTVVEDAFGNFRRDEYQEWLSTSPYDRERSSYMVHSVPEEEIEVLVLELRERAAFLFVTDLKAQFYESFGPAWKKFVAAMAV